MFKTSVIVKFVVNHKIVTLCRESRTVLYKRKKIRLVYSLIREEGKYMLTAERIIKLYNMKPLPGEGGYYVETYRSGEMVAKESLPERYDSDRPHGTAIFYLLTPDTHSNIHRLKSDEIYHFYLGDPIQLVLIHPNGTTKVLFLGHDIQAGQFVQAFVPAGMWQGAYLLEGGEFALMGTTVTPGFDFSDTELGVRSELLKQYPQHRDFITRLTPPEP
jgi:predicted cupin superfamily sugar epimerase